jgi:hypothetical protein
MNWLTPVARALDRRVTPLEVFVRDDDAGWVDERLYALLDCCAARQWPIDLAVIPTAVHRRLAAELIGRAGEGAAIGLHQHGFSHANHEAEGRPCEFGSWRSRDVQQRDIAEGRMLLLRFFGSAIDPIFTPPWNRCAPFTWQCLLDTGLTAISRDRTAAPLAPEPLPECAIHVDWFARVKGTRLTPVEWAERLAREISLATAPLGLMLHHAAMDRDELVAFEALLELFTDRGVRAMLMRDVLARRKAVMPTRKAMIQ